jgi:Cof subfamily protein (haloacid dehalogenase superfamily)
MPPRLLAFDLDGTLLTSDKRLSRANAAALNDMAARGATVVLASGRIGSSMMRYVRELACDPALLTLNGAAVFTGARQGARLVYSAPLDPTSAAALVEHSEKAAYAVNYYCDGAVYTVRNGLTARWNDLYYAQTSSEFRLMDSLRPMEGRSPHKIIFVGEPAVLDKEEFELRKRWGSSLYIVRTWDYYLEFLSPVADKGKGLAALAKEYGVPLSESAAFGDADNDIPLFAAARVAVAVKNASLGAKAAATLVSRWTNDEDAVAREWERMKIDAASGNEKSR